MSARSIDDILANEPKAIGPTSRRIRKALREARGIIVDVDKGFDCFAEAGIDCAEIRARLKTLLDKWAGK